MPNPQAIVAIMLALTLMIFIVGSAVITVMGAGMNADALGFWSHFLSTVVGGLIGFISGNNKEGPK